MSRSLQLIGLIAAALGCTALLGAANGDKRRSNNAAPVTPPATAAVAPAGSFEAFRLITERNSFNANRTSRTRGAPEEKPARVDTIALVGTMNYEKGLVAFFESPDASFRKTVRVGDAIAEFKVERIANDGVDLTRDGGPLALKVSQQLRRIEGGDWALFIPPDAAANQPGLRSPTAPPPTEVPADASDVLKRLLKKREKQLN
jgi:hypothetical protein